MRNHWVLLPLSPRVSLCLCLCFCQSLSLFICLCLSLSPSLPQATTISQTSFPCSAFTDSAPTMQCLNSSLGHFTSIAVWGPWSLIQVDSATDNQKHHHFWGNSWWMLGTRQAAVSRAFSPLPRCKVAWSHLQTAATPLPPARGSAGRGPCSPHSARQGCGSAPGRAAPPHAGSSPQEAAKVWQLGLPAPGEVNVPSK